MVQALLSVVCLCRNITRLHQVVTVVFMRNDCGHCLSLRAVTGQYKLPTYVVLGLWIGLLLTHLLKYSPWVEFTVSYLSSTFASCWFIIISEFASSCSSWAVLDGCRYREVDETHHLVQWFWEILESFSNDERILFMRFVSGRSRLPMNPADISQRFQILKIDRVHTMSRCYCDIEWLRHIQVLSHYQLLSPTPQMYFWALAAAMLIWLLLCHEKWYI